MKFLRSFYVDTKKIFMSGGFWLCLAMTAVLLFTATVYTDFDTQNRYSALSALMYFTEEERKKIFELCNITVMRNAVSGWLSMFVPIITAFCFVPQFCAERDGNSVRFQIFRSSKLAHGLSRFFSGVISGGLAVTLGYAFFCGAVYLLFPSVSQMDEYSASIIADMRFSFSESLLAVWLYGAFWSIPSMFCTSIMRNKYLIMCIPFFVKYALTQTVQKLYSNAIADFENIDSEMFDFADTVNPDGLLYAFGGIDSLKVFLLFGLTAAAFLAGYLIIRMNWRDQGA